MLKTGRMIRVLSFRFHRCAGGQTLMALLGTLQILHSVILLYFLSKSKQFLKAPGCSEFFILTATLRMPLFLKTSILHVRLGDYLSSCKIGIPIFLAKKAPGFHMGPRDVHLIQKCFNPTTICKYGFYHT